MAPFNNILSFFSLFFLFIEFELVYAGCEWMVYSVWYSMETIIYYDFGTSFFFSFFCNLRILFDEVFIWFLRLFVRPKITNLYELLLSTDNLILYLFFSPAHSSNLCPFLGHSNYRYSKLMRRFYFVVSFFFSLSVFVSFI